VIWTTIHCPSLFYLHGSRGYLNTFDNFVSDYLERQQVAQSDVVVSPSLYMLQWVQSRYWQLPPLTFVQQNLLTPALIEQSRSIRHINNDNDNDNNNDGNGNGDGDNNGRSAPASLSSWPRRVEAHQREQQAWAKATQVQKPSPLTKSATPLDNLDSSAVSSSSSASMNENDKEKEIRVALVELVFFARLEILKGIYEFCDALDILTRRLANRDIVLPLYHGAKPFAVTMMGLPNLPDKSAVDMILERASAGHWPFAVTFQLDLLQPQAVAYMRGGEGRVAVLASLVENSPYTVLECLSLGIPFIASHVGGVAELIDASYHDNILFDPIPDSLADRITNIAINGVPLAKPTSLPTATRDQWLVVHQLVHLHHHWNRDIYASAIKGFNHNSLTGIAAGLWLQPSQSSSTTSARTSESMSNTLLPLNNNGEFYHLRLMDDAHRVSSTLTQSYTLPASPLPSPTSSLPLVSVCMVHRDRSHLLLYSIAALLRQDYPLIEIVLVDNDSRLPSSVTTLSLLERLFTKPAVPSADVPSLLLTTIELSRLAAVGIDEKLRARALSSTITFRLIKAGANLWPGAARNRGVAESHGQWVMFLDDDDIPQPSMVSIMYNVAITTRADIVTTMCDFFNGDVGAPSTSMDGTMSMLRWLPLGPAIDVGMYGNVFGAYAAFISRTAWNLIGGFTTEVTSPLHCIVKC
jgi:glycosyltransferase involved in cell wall biosynthesis